MSEENVQSDEEPVSEEEEEEEEEEASPPPKNRRPSQSPRKLDRLYSLIARTTTFRYVRLHLTQTSNLRSATFSMARTSKM
jgi:hypothetical protein